MNIKLTDHGRSLIDQLQLLNREKADVGKKNELQPKNALRDVYEKAKTAKPDKEKGLETGDKSKEKADAIKADGLNISFQFDLFYELNAKVEAKMGQSGSNRFVELSGKVSETFMGSFNLSIDAVGSFMNGTDKSLDISPETTGKFFDAVEGLADLSPEALENFLKESDQFFASLEDTYGKANGAFDKIKGLMQEQAKAFFADVGDARKQALEGPKQQVKQEIPATNAVDSQKPAIVGPTGPGSLIELLFQPGKTATQNDYKSFLEDFANYAAKFRQQMFEKLLGNKLPGYDKALKTGEDNDASNKKIVDTAI